MKDFYYLESSKFFSFLGLICIFQLIINVSPKLNNIIRLGDKDFTYNHISINSKGDMVIDTSSQSSKERKFYGLKKNGTPFFGNSFYKTLSVNTDKYKGRNPGEVLFIKYTKNNDYSNIEEFLAYIPQKNGNDDYVEYYFFDENVVYINKTSSMGLNDIESFRFGVLSEAQNNLEYIFCYVYGNKLNIYQGYFNYTKKVFSEINTYTFGQGKKALMISCYCTKNKKKNMFLFN